MPFSTTGALLTLAALGNLSVAALPPCSAGERTITVEICGQDGHMTIPLDGSDPPSPKRECIGACHAMCTRRKAIVEPE